MKHVYGSCKRCQAGLKPRTLEDVKCQNCVGIAYRPSNPKANKRRKNLTPGRN